MLFLRCLCSALFLLFSFACVAQDNRDLHILASVRPITLIAQELTQGLPIQVDTLLPEGTTPHDYNLKPSDLMKIKSANMVIWLGDHSERYLKKVIVNHPDAIAWESVKDLKRLPMREMMAEDADHDHSDHHGHDHDAPFDLHIWFGSENAQALAKAMVERLVMTNPDWATVLNTNLQQFKQHTDANRHRAQKLLSTNTQPFLLSHDAYHYLEEDLGVHSVGAVVSDPEVKPGVKHLMALKRQVKQQRVRCVLTDPSVSSALLDKIDTAPPFKRALVDPLAWDFKQNLYSQWLVDTYQKIISCVAAQ